MPFDGIDYQGASQISPYSYHPETPATARVLFHSLRGAYFFSRMHARNIGQQTYRIWLADAHVYNSTTSSISSLTAIDIARFRRRLPAHATHVGASIWFRVFGADAVLATHRVVVTDGTDTDTGLNAVSEVSMEPIVEAGSFGFDATQSPFDPGIIGVGHAACEVALSSVTLPARCTVTVEAYAADTGDTPSVAMRYQPFFVSAWMWSEG